MRFPCLWVVSSVLAIGCQPDPGGVGTTTDSPATSAATSSPTAEASSAETAVTSGGDATVSTSTVGTSTGPGDGTVGSSTAPGESSGPPPETTGDPPPEGEPYGPCGPGGTCAGADVVCFEGGAGDMCLPPCDGTNPSCPPPPPDNGTLVECIEVLGVHCMLNCADGAACPAGTTCVDLSGGIFRCLWT